MDIGVTDKSLRRIAGAAKRKGDAALPKSVVERLPEILRSPSAVLWDKQKDNLTYVFDVVDAKKRKAKLIVNVEFRESKVGKTGNFVRSGGLVAAANLRRPSVYELVEGRTPK